MFLVSVTCQSGKLDICIQLNYGAMGSRNMAHFGEIVYLRNQKQSNKTSKLEIVLFCKQQLWKYGIENVSC